MKFSALILLFHCLICSAGESPWWRHALRLSGESDRVRSAALRSIREIPDLNALLTRELQGERRFLALDVISALKLHALRNELLHLAERDDTGFFYSTVNGLMEGENPETLASLYRVRAMATETSPAARAVLLDTLGRMGAPLLPVQLGQLLQDPNQDVQSAALDHLRSAVLRQHRPEYLPLVTGPFDRGSFQLRLQILNLLSELSPREREGCHEVLKNCVSDSNSEVRALCVRMRGEKRSTRGGIGP